MSVDQNSDDGPDTPLGGMMIPAVSAKTDAQAWGIRLDGDTLRGTAQVSAQSFTVDRSEAVERLEVHDGLFLQRALSVKPPAALLKFEPSGYRALKDWIGQDLLLKMILKVRIRWGLPLGLVFILGSLPLAGDPEAGIPDIPFNWVNALLGSLLIVSALFGRRRPHPHYLLLDAVWWTILAAVSVQDIIGGGHKAWLLLVLVQLRFSYTGIRDWNRFLTGRY